ncbi:MAG: MobQ family relaxase [Oliverpabstia sp.]
MAIYHMEAKVISRGSGRSAVAASAYMSCSRMYNDYDGIQHDYTRKHGLVYQEVMLPPMAPTEWKDREQLWNAVEDAEKTKDSRLAREFVIALPIELDTDSNISLLQNFIKKNFVDMGMCADFAIHDTDRHNPHAHILLTVRPLNENGTWQYKTEKEYLCIKNGEEKEFTASEFREAQKEGWEKQYRYKSGKKKIYLTPSAAQEKGYERVDKHPKSTRYGRQNPISEQWNSDEQLCLWRANWADTVNRELECRQIDTRIDHRSFSDQGITEQPTIHEGYIARDMEKKGIISDRCELNRQIRSDNRLLGELKRQVAKLTKSIKESIPAIAEALENIRGTMIIFQYQMLHNEMQTTSAKEWIKMTKPVVEKYKATKQKINKKQEERKVLKTKKQKLSILNPLQHYQLNQQITTLTEDIEELKSKKNFLMGEIYCHNDAEMKNTESTLKQQSAFLEKLAAQRQALNEQLGKNLKKFIDLKFSVVSEKSEELLDARVSFRDFVRDRIVSRLRDVYGKKFEYDRLNDASDYIDGCIQEDPYLFRERARQKAWEQEQERKRNQPNKAKNKSSGYEL